MLPLPLLGLHQALAGSEGCPRGGAYSPWLLPNMGSCHGEEKEKADPGLLHGAQRTLRAELPAGVKLQPPPTPASCPRSPEKAGLPSPGLKAPHTSAEGLPSHAEGRAFSSPKPRHFLFSGAATAKPCGHTAQKLLTETHQPSGAPLVPPPRPPAKSSKKQQKEAGTVRCTRAGGPAALAGSAVFDDLREEVVSLPGRSGIAGFGDSCGHGLEMGALESSG